MGFKAATESGVLRACRQWLTLWGALVIRVNSGGMKIENRYMCFNSEEGCADTLVCLPGGRWLSLEAKRPGGRTDPERAAKQAAHRERVRKAGGLALVVGSLDELLRLLAAEGYDTGTQRR